MTPKPLVVLVPAPQRVERILAPDRLAALHEAFEVVVPDDEHPGELDALLPRAFAVVGQPDLPRERLDRAPGLRAIVNVEGNFYPNVDYPTCFERGIHVLGCGPVYAVPVAEYALGLALDLCRGISRADRDFRSGTERYAADGNADAIVLSGADVGFLGYGNLGRALHRLLVPFRPTLRVYDPWLPAAAIAEAGAVPCSIDDTIRSSTVLFVLATVTADSEHLLGARELDLAPPRARVLMLSRAAVVDLDALLDRVAAGRLTAAIDVWPDEPTPADHRARTLDGLVLSAHRAGGIPSAFREIGERLVDDLLLIERGLPPVRMQAAARELVGRYRNRPVD